MILVNWSVSEACAAFKRLLGVCVLCFDLRGVLNESRDFFVSPPVRLSFSCGDGDFWHVYDCESAEAFCVSPF